MAGFNFNLETDYDMGQHAMSMVEQVLRWDGIYRADAVPVIAQHILKSAKKGETERDFRRWCNTPDAPFCISSWQEYATPHSDSRKWPEILFTSVVLDIYASHRYNQIRESSNEDFPYWQLDCMSRYCKKHSSLDQYIARPDDPIWEDIFPPNGWMCGCSVLPIMDFDVPPRKRIGRPVSEELRTQCRNWLQTRPDHILKLL